MQFFHFNKEKLIYLFLSNLINFSSRLYLFIKKRKNLHKILFFSEYIFQTLRGIFFSINKKTKKLQKQFYNIGYIKYTFTNYIKDLKSTKRKNIFIEVSHYNKNNHIKNGINRSIFQISKNLNYENKFNIFFFTLDLNHFPFFHAFGQRDFFFPNSFQYLIFPQNQLPMFYLFKNLG